MDKPKISKVKYTEKKPKEDRKSNAEKTKTKKDKKAKKASAEAADGPKAAKAPKVKAPKVPATPEEEARRQKQRESRERALAARVGGKAYVASRKVKAKKRPQQAQRKYEQRQEGLPSKAERNTERRAAQTAAKAEKLKAPTVIIVPIFWKGEAQQMAIVLSVCADVQKAGRSGFEASSWRWHAGPHGLHGWRAPGSGLLSALTRWLEGRLGALRV